MYVVKYKVRNKAKGLLKHHCYCPMSLMWTTKITVTNKGHLSSLLCVLIGVLAKFHE